MSKIVERIERQAGVPDLVSVLAERLTPTDLQSLLLEVHRRRSDGLRPADVLSRYEADRFVRPSPNSPARQASWERTAFSHLPEDFEPLALSPVCPLGTCSVVAPIAPGWSVSTTRNTEVVSDSTNVLALECAVRRRQLLRSDPRSTTPVHLAASHRLVRTQPFEGPKMFSHFGCFALCSAGRDQGGQRFELETLARHIRFYVRAMGTFLGPDAQLYLSVTDFSENPSLELLEGRLLSPLRSRLEEVDCAIDQERTQGRGYYPGLCFAVDVTDASGQRLNLADGGVVDWTQQYLSNAKERLVTSGIGSERLCAGFSHGPR